MTNTPENSAIELGKLIQKVDGLGKALDDQNTNSEKRRIEQKLDAEKDRKEFMDIFKEIRDEIKTSNEIVQSHVKEDAPFHSMVMELVKWKTEVEPNINTMWDRMNKGIGATMASGIFGTLVGSVIVTAVEYFKKG